MMGRLHCVDHRQHLPLTTYQREREVHLRNGYQKQWKQQSTLSSIIISSSRSHKPHASLLKAFGKPRCVKITIVSTRFFCKNLKRVPSTIALETISDGFDKGGMDGAESYKVYYERFREVGSETLAELIQKLGKSGKHVDCIIYNSFLPWALDIAKRFGIVGAVYLTQNLAVNSIYYHYCMGKLQVPLTEFEISLPALPKLELGDMPSFFFKGEKNPALLDLLVGQFSNIDQADWILCNAFYELDKELADWLMKIWPKLRTIGPNIPYMFLDKQYKDDQDQGVSQFKSEECMEWLDNKPKGSVVYVSFGSMVAVDEEQMEEIAYGLKDSESYFLWVVRASEEIKLPRDFEKISEKGLVVTWCSQLQVLSHEAVGCFVTHCGWNSTLEALSLGVPLLTMPQWSDQNTNAKYIGDVWKMGIRAPVVDEKNIVKREALRDLIKEMLKSERGKEMMSNAMHWKTLAARAVGEGGSSHKNFTEFVKALFHSQP